MNRSEKGKKNKNKMDWEVPGACRVCPEGGTPTTVVVLVVSGSLTLMNAGFGYARR
jgi:hypothetical protein